MKYFKREPLQIIDNLPIVDKSYASALELPQKRYDNPALLIHSQVTRFTQHSTREVPAVKGAGSKCQTVLENQE